MRFQRFLNTVKHPITDYHITKAKNIKREEHPECAVCGRVKAFFTQRKNDVHHEEPVHVSYALGRPERAVAQDNLTTLCRLCHFIVGHLRNWKDWNKKLKGTIKGLKVVMKDAIRGTDKELQNS